MQTPIQLYSSYSELELLESTVQGHSLSVQFLSAQVGGGVGGGGLGVLSAAVLLAGEMAGSGVLALPDAMIGTGQLYILCSEWFI